MDMDDVLTLIIYLYSTGIYQQPSRHLTWEKYTGPFNRRGRKERTNTIMYYSRLEDGCDVVVSLSYHSEYDF